MRVGLFLFVCFWLLLQSFADLQGQTVRFEHIGTEEGLENLDIQAILQDRQGFIWVATMGGLHRFDGYGCKVFKYDAERKNSLSSNLVYCLYQDTDGFVWVGTRYGMNRLNPKTETFTAHTHFEGNYLLENKAIRHIYQDKKKNLWVSVSAVGLLHFDWQTQRFDKFFSPQNTKNPLLAYPKFFYQDRKGNQWLGSDGGLALFFEHTQQFVNLPTNLLPSQYIKCIFEDNENNLWIGTDGGLALLPQEQLRLFQATDTAILQFQRFANSPNNKYSLSNNFVKAINQDQEGNLWVATDNGVSFLNQARLKNKTYYFTNFVHNENDEQSLSNNYCRTVTADQQNIIWIGGSGGISKYVKDRFPFRRFQHEKNNPNSLNDNYVRAIACQKISNPAIKSNLKYLSDTYKVSDKFKKYLSDTSKVSDKLSAAPDSLEIVWVGTNSGVAKFDKTNKQFSFLSIAEGLPFNQVKALATDQQQQLWIGTDKGLAVLNTKTNQLKTYLYDKDKPHSIPDNAINCIHVDKEGVVWIGTWKGVVKYEPATDNFSEVYPQLEDRVQCILKDSDNELWIGTRDGLIRLQNEIASTVYTHETNNTKSLSSSYINCLLQIEKGKLLIGTSNGGLSRFDKKTGVFEHFTEADHLPNNNINCMIAGNDNRLWLGTDKGLSRIDFDTKRIRTYLISDGLAGASFSHLAVDKFSNGEVFIGTLSGFSSFAPKRIKDNSYSPPVYVTNYSLFRKVVSIDQQKALTHNLLFDRYLTLKHSDKMITFDFIALDYRNPHQIKYAYKLENFDDDWHYTNAENRQATYTNLPAGNYKFMVKATNNDGYWSRNESTTLVEVKPPYWKTWWFLLCCGLAISVVLYGFQYWREKDLIATQNRLEREVEERTAELVAEKNKLEDAKIEISINLEEIEAQRDEIEAQRDNIARMNSALEIQVQDRTQKLVEKNKELDQFLYRAAHDLKGPLARMKGLVNLGIIETQDEIAVEYFEKLDSLSVEMLQLLNRIRQIHDIKNKKVVSEVVDFEQIIENILYHVIRKHNLAMVKIQTDTSPLPYFTSDKELLTQLLRNLIENAAAYVDYSQKSKIKISVLPCTPLTDEQQGVKIMVEDNGIGIDPQVHERVFSMFFVGTSLSKGMGLGLYEVKLIAEKLNGQVSFICQDGWTKFWVVV